MSTTQELIERIQRAAHWAVSENDHFEPELGLEAAARLSELSAELDALRGKLAGVDEKALEAASIARIKCAVGRNRPDLKAVMDASPNEAHESYLRKHPDEVEETRAAISAYLAAVGQKP